MCLSTRKQFTSFGVYALSICHQGSSLKVVVSARCVCQQGNLRGWGVNASCVCEQGSSFKVVVSMHHVFINVEAV